MIAFAVAIYFNYLKIRDKLSQYLVWHEYFICIIDMENSNCEEKKEQRRKEALERHAQLHKLFVEDRLGFERERKRIIDEFINSVEDEERRNRLRDLQDSWDTKMRHAGSAHNKFVLAQTFFWKNFYEVWYPAIQEANLSLNGKLKMT